MTYPELAGEGGRARFVVLATEVDAARAWTRRWQRLLSCAAAKAFAQSLLDVVPSGSDGRTPSVHEVICDDRFFC